MTTFDRFAAELTYADVPDAALRVLRRSFLDTMGVAAVGSTTPLAAIARKGATALFGVTDAGPARMMMNGTTVSPAGAAGRDIRGSVVRFPS